MKTKTTLILGVIALGTVFLIQSCSQESDGGDPEQLDLLASYDQDTKTCDCPDSNSFMIPDKICVTGSFLDSMPAESEILFSSPPPPNTTNAPNWTYCSSGRLKPVESGLSTPIVTGQGNTIYCSDSDIPTEAGSEEQPTIIVYNKPSNDTLFCIISYNDNTKYASSSIKFDYRIGREYNYIKTFLLDDDPKTSRGTVTTVQSHKGPIKKWD